MVLYGLSQPTSEKPLSGRAEVTAQESQGGPTPGYVTCSTNAEEENTHKHHEYGCLRHSLEQRWSMVACHVAAQHPCDTQSFPGLAYLVPSAYKRYMISKVVHLSQAAQMHRSMPSCSAVSLLQPSLCCISPYSSVRVKMCHVLAV